MPLIERDFVERATIKLSREGKVLALGQTRYHEIVRGETGEVTHSEIILEDITPETIRLILPAEAEMLEQIASQHLSLREAADRHHDLHGAHCDMTGRAKTAEQELAIAREQLKALGEHATQMELRLKALTPDPAAPAS